jgi:hypothetical protein
MKNPIIRISCVPDRSPSQFIRINGVFLCVHLFVRMIKGLECLVTEQQKKWGEIIGRTAAPLGIMFGCKLDARCAT